MIKILYPNAILSPCKTSLENNATEMHTIDKRAKCKLKDKIYGWSIDPRIEIIKILVISIDIYLIAFMTRDNNFYLQ